MGSPFGVSTSHLVEFLAGPHKVWASIPPIVRCLLSFESHPAEASIYIVGYVGLYSIMCQATSPSRVILLRLPCKQTSQYVSGLLSFESHPVEASMQTDVAAYVSLLSFESHPAEASMQTAFQVELEKWPSLSEEVLQAPRSLSSESFDVPRISFGAPDEDEMSIAASHGGQESLGSDDSAVLPPSGAPALSVSDPELTAMLSRAAAAIGLEWSPPPGPVHSRLDDWFLDAAANPRQRPTPMPFFLDVHKEVTRSWKAPLSSRDRSATSSALPPLDQAAAKGYTGVPQVERSVAMQLCPQSASSRGDPKHPSKDCRFSSTLVAKSYRAAGQAASSLHAMATLLVYQAQLLRDMHEWRTDPGFFDELHAATDLALRVTKVTARSLGQVMSTCVVQERHLWLNLADMRETERTRFLNTPISQAGLFGGAVEDFAQQFLTAQKQTEALKHVLPRRPAAASTQPSAQATQSARRQGRPPVAPAPPARPQKQPSPGPRRGGSPRKAPVEGKSVGKHDLVIRFLRGARRLNPHCAPLVPSWDLSVVLTALQSAPFEPLQSVELKFLSMKTALLVALASIKRVGDLQAFSVDEACLEFGPANSHVILRPRPGYVPKVPTTPFRGGRPSLDTALSSTRPPCLRRQNAVFQDLRPALCLSWWEAEGKGSLQAKVVSLDSGRHCCGLPAARSTMPPCCDGPLHSECGILLGSSAWRLANRHCRAAGWATPNTFVRFYNLRVEPVSSHVLASTSRY
ncbi:unnamed protein product [Leuciscus chuanchicus]